MDATLIIEVTGSKIFHDFLKSGEASMAQYVKYFLFTLIKFQPGLGYLITADRHQNIGT